MSFLNDYSNFWSVVESFGIFSIKEAREKLAESAGVDNQSKQKIYQKLFKVLDDLTSNWQNRSRSL